MKKMNALMLGWHPSPLLSGGLGVASLEIAKSLSELVNLSLILPETDPGVILKNIDLTGLGDMEVEEIKVSLATPLYEVFAPTQYIKTDLLPYQTYTEENKPSKAAMGTEVLTRAILNAPAPNRPTQPLRPNQGGPALKQSWDKKQEAFGDDLNYKVIQYARFAARLTSTKDIDVIYAHDWLTFQAGIEIKRVTGKPLVLHVHTLQYDRKGPQGKGWVYEMERKALASADAVISVSQYTAAILEEHYGVDPEKITPVYHGLEPIKTFRTEKAAEDRQVVFLGRFAEQKGPSYFLQMALKVQEHYPLAQFIMAGTGPLLEETKTSAEALVLGNKIQFPGFLPKKEVYDLLSRADVFVMPSVSDPFGLSALEAAQFGVPVVLSKQAGVGEVLRNALKADYHDTDLLARHVLHLLTDEDFRQRMIADTFYDIEHLTWDNTAEEILEVFQQVQPG
jgi:glycogen synthase